MICNLTGIASQPGNGRTRPVRVFCEAPDGTEFEAYLKAPHLGEKPFPCLLEREWFAGKLAHQLGLPCALPLQIRLDPDVAASEQDPVLRAKLLAAPEILFGSLNGGPGWSLWTEATVVPSDRAQIAAAIYMFDTIIQNWDRSNGNPNLLVKGDKFLMIDHGEAFVYATAEGSERDMPPKPWLLGGVINAHLGEWDTHPLWAKLRPKNHVDFGAAANRWKALPADAFSLIAADVPDCWSKVTASRIAAYMNEAMENLNEIVANIEYNFNR
ncbi:HipA family kinase [Paracoccus litorisediminis]|uniref:HipA family kinase n=1 Tax=Paracoccus litorisediminis TaxID=2006130 RepID=UPI003733520F